MRNHTAKFLTRLANLDAKHRAMPLSLYARHRRNTKGGGGMI